MSEPKDLIRAKEHLQPSETVVEWSNGVCESTMFGKETTRTGIVIATEKRLFVFVPKMFNSFDLEEYPYATMSSIEYGKGMLGHTAKFIASGNATKISMMNLGNPKALVDYVREQIGKKNQQKSNCPECGFANNIEWQFCGSCGKTRAQAMASV